MSRLLVMGILLIVCIAATVAQPLSEGDSIRMERRKVRAMKDSIRAQKNFRYMILGGPGYNPNRGFTLSANSIFSFNTPSMMGSKQRSNIPLILSMSYATELGYMIQTTPTLFLCKDKIRVTGDIKFSDEGAHYHGVGYATNKSRPRSKEHTYYNATAMKVNPTVYFRISDSRWMMGPVFNVMYDIVDNPTKTMMEDPYYIKNGGTATGFKSLNMGLGLTASYDSRDVILNAYSGLLFEIKALEYNGVWGSEKNYGSLMFDYRQYISLSKKKTGRTLAWRVTSDMTHGNVPFVHLPTLGSANDLRGYYGGQYRDKITSLILVEYRHEFHCDNPSFMGRLWNRVGFATWVGSGFVGSNWFKMYAALPNLGAGLRFEMQPRTNVRFDVGWSPIDNQVLVYFGFAEAF